MIWGWAPCLFGGHNWTAVSEFGDKQCLRCKRGRHE